MPINLDFVARRWADDGGRATERGDWGILPPALRKLAMPSIPDAPPPLMLGGKLRHHGIGGGSHHLAGEIGRFSIWLIGLNVDAIGEAGNQLAALGENLQVNSLEQNWNRFGSSFNHTTIFNNERQSTFTTGNFTGQSKTDGTKPLIIDLGRAAAYLHTIHPGGDRHLCSSGHAAFSAFHIESGTHFITRSITITQEGNLRLEPGSAIGADVKLALRGRMTIERIGSFDQILTTGLTLRHLPGKAPGAVLGVHGAAAHHVPFGSGYLNSGICRLVGR